MLLGEFPAQLTGLGATLVIVGLIGLATLYSSAETAIVSVRRPRVQQLLEEGSAAAQSLQRLLDNSVGFAATSQIVVIATVLAANTVLVAAYGPALSQMIGITGAYVVLTAFALAVALVLVRQIGNALGLRYAETMALGMCSIARATMIVLWPLVRLVSATGSVIHRQARSGSSALGAGVTEAGIMLQVDVAEEEGVLEEEEGEMIRSIFEFGDTVAREIMVPRIDVVAAEADATLGDVLDMAVAAGHSRIPVFEESIDKIVGIFYVKDSLRFLRNGRLDVHVRDVTRPAYFVPETKKVDELLREMQSRRVHLAVVVDEYGGTAGLVTIEDILEEIVGEIQDEFDAEEAMFEHVTENEAVVDALMTLDDVNDLLSIHLQAEDVDTLGGYVYAMLGRVPEKGDEIEVEGMRLVVEEVEGNRINKVRIIKRSEPPAPGPATAETGEPQPNSAE